MTEDCGKNAEHGSIYRKNEKKQSDGLKKVIDRYYKLVMKDMQLSYVRSFILPYRKSKDKRKD